MQSVRVAVQIVLYGRADRLPRLLAGLDRMDTGAARATVRLIDNSEEATTPAVVRDASLRLPLDYVRSPRGNSGFGTGQNVLAAQSADADYLLVLNPDTIPFFDMLTRLIDRAEASPNAAMVEAAQFPIEHQKDYDRLTGHTDWCCAAAVLVRTPMFRALGGFDERIFLYCEDVDLSWRAWLAGYECIYEPRAKCVHVSQEEDIGKDRTAEIYHMELGNLYLRSKWFGTDAVAEHLDFLRSRVPPDTLHRLQSDLARIAPPAPQRVTHPRVRLNPDHINYGPARW